MRPAVLVGLPAGRRERPREQVTHSAIVNFSALVKPKSGRIGQPLGRSCSHCVKSSTPINVGAFGTATTVGLAGDNSRSADGTTVHGPQANGTYVKPTINARVGNVGAASSIENGWPSVGSPV